MCRAMIPPIFTSTRLCVTACGKFHPRCCQSVAWKRRNSPSRLPAGIIPVHCTTSCKIQSCALEDGRNNRPKYVELIGIINKPLLLHLVSCLYYILCFLLDKKSNLLVKSVSRKNNNKL